MISLLKQPIFILSYVKILLLIILYCTLLCNDYCIRNLSCIEIVLLYFSIALLYIFK